MKKVVFGLFFLLCAGSFVLAQEQTLKAVDQGESPEVAHIEWMSWEEATAANEEEPRKILVDVYTDWCGWCKVMDRKTFTDPDVVSYVNDNFHAIKLNAEQKETINWNGYEFKWMAGGRNGVHMLAYSLLNKQLSYPQFVLLDEEFKRIRIIKGFKDAKSFMPELEYAASEQYKAGQIEKADLEEAPDAESPADKKSGRSR